MKVILTAVLFLMTQSVAMAENKAPAAAKPVASKAAPKVDSAEPKKAEPKKAATQEAKSPATVAPAPGAKSQEPTVELMTNMGPITIKLFPQKAPVSVKNFLKYVDEKFYDNTVFHRVISDFMIQGGGFAKTPEGLSQKVTGNGIINESRNGLKNTRGTVAMARKGMSSWTDSSSTTSQFFINVVDNANLDYPLPDGFGYTVFGEVTKGSLGVVDKIKSLDTRDQLVKALGEGNKLSEQRMPNIPAKDAIILTARRL